MYHNVGTPNDPIGYYACPCREKLTFPRGSLILKYLEEECKGWVRSSDSKYTLNYMVTILTLNFKHNGLLGWSGIVMCDDKLRKATGLVLFSINSTRSMLKRFITKEVVEPPHCLFLCMENPYTTSIIKEYSLEKHNYTRCINRGMS